jgi:hypothetical protein
MSLPFFKLVVLLEFSCFCFLFDLRDYLLKIILDIVLCIISLQFRYLVHIFWDKLPIDLNAIF